MTPRIQLDTIHTLTYIQKFTFICTCSNILGTPAYGVCISHSVQYSRACGSYQDLLDRGLLLVKKLLNQGSLLGKSKSPHRTFYGRHHVVRNIFVTNDHGQCSVCRNLVISILMTLFVTKVTRRVSLEVQELLTLPEYMSS